MTVSGRSRLQDIQRQLIEAINNPVTALDTPAGERHFLLFLRSKIAEIQDIVDTGALTDEDHAKLTRALGSGYLLPDIRARQDAPPAATSGGAPMADQAAGMLPAVGSALGALPQAAQGAATAPAQGAGGLAGAATPLAGLASGLLDRTDEPDLPEDRVDRSAEIRRGRRTSTSDARPDAERGRRRADDRPTEPQPPGDREPPGRRSRADPARPPAVGAPMTTIRITPSLLNQVAARHDSVADEIAVARSAGSEILAAVATHGPIMHQFKAAANEVVQRRDAAFADHEAAHRAAADKSAFHRGAIR